MNDALRIKQLSEVLSNLADELDVPPSKYAEAKAHYDAVAAWLGENGSELAPYAPTIYPQGSFAIGTAVRPVGADDYDVDAVCLLTIGAALTDPKNLKGMVGARLLHPASRYKHMIDPPTGGRRCWTIKYADASKFHLDVLPAIPDGWEWLVLLGVPQELAQHAIRITDRTTWDQPGHWPRSNPRGYTEWFKSRMAFRLDEAKRLLAVEKRADVTGIEDYEVRTPLQRLIQILKRHRDVRYNGDDDKPVSIIITTLAAAAYDNEADTADALLSVVPRMRGLVTQERGGWVIRNPVNPRENFADKWAEKPRKAELFFEWLNAVEREHRALLTDRGWEGVQPYLTETYGERDANAAVAKYASRYPQRMAAGAAAPFVLVPKKTDVAPRTPAELPASPSKPWGS